MQYDIERIRLEMEVIPAWDSQIMLQTVEGCTDPMYGTGSLLDFMHKNAEHDFTVPLWDMPYTNSIMEELGLYRTRLLRLEPRQNYTYHKDPTKRLHIPIKTSKDCFFIIEDEVHRYPDDGRAVIIDTTKKHTAVNASKVDRIHLVGCLGKSNKEYNSLKRNGVQSPFSLV